MTQLREQLRQLESRLRAEQESAAAAAAADGAAVKLLKAKNAQLLSELEASHAHGNKMAGDLETATAELTRFLETVSAQSDAAALRAEQARRRELETRLTAAQAAEQEVRAAAAAAAHISQGVQSQLASTQAKLERAQAQVQELEGAVAQLSTSCAGALQPSACLSGSALAGVPGAP